MAQLLGQLRCASCRRDFWPERSDAVSLVVLCPACGAAHANPGALPYRIEHYDQRGETVVAWLNRHWPDAPPLVRATYGPLFGAQEVQTGTLDGFAYCVVWTPHTPVGLTFLLIPALPPPSAPPIHAGYGLTTQWCRAGLWAHNGRELSPASFEGPLRELIAQIRGAGATPLHAMEASESPAVVAEDDELEAYAPPDPAADARLETQRARCGGCGAAVSAADLLGNASCPYCGAAQSLFPEVLHQLQMRQNRARAAAIAAEPLQLTWWQTVHAPAPAHVKIACIYCGAPNDHLPGRIDETCFSCRAPLIPSKAAAARDDRLVASATEAAHGAAAVGVARRLASAQRTAQDAGNTVAVLVGGLMVATLPVYALVTYFSFRSGHGVDAFVPLVFGVAMSTGVLLFVWRRTKQRRAVQGVWQPRLHALAEQLAAPEVGSPPQLTKWAHVWWHDQLPTHWLFRGPGQGTLAFQVAGFPIAATAHVDVMAPLMPTGLDTAPHLAILLACELPRDVTLRIERGAAARARAALRDAGFELELRTGGLSLQATFTLLNAIRAQPDRLAMIAPAAFALANLAHQLHAQPPRAGGSGAP